MSRKQLRVQTKPSRRGPPQAAPATSQAFTDAVQHHQAGRLDEADACYRRIIALKPDHADAHYNLGILLEQKKRSDEAAAWFQKTIDLKPDYADAHYALGILLREHGRLDEAVARYRRAIDLKPDFPQAHCNLGVALQEQGQLEQAAECYQTAFALNPDFAAAYYNLGILLYERSRWEDASLYFRKAVALKPEYWEAHNNLGMALREQGRFDEAVACCRVSIGINPAFAESYVNLGITLYDQRRLNEAVASFQAAIVVQPDSANAHFALAQALLAQGNLLAAWEEYEWRWKTSPLNAIYREFPVPRWRGEAAEGRTLLIHAEQGFGDTLQFCRYALLAVQRGLLVVMEVQQPLVSLLRRLPGVDKVVAQGDALPDFDLHCPMVGMPGALGTTLETIPAGAPYLRADELQIQAWRARLAAIDNPGPRIGLVWAGNPRLKFAPAQAAMDRRRSLSPDRFAPLFAQPGLHFISLQKDGPAAQEGAPLTDFMPEVTDFADTAALIANLDLVISVDTSVAHLAAALGKPVWLLNRFDSCWRWLTNRSDSPWYPTMRLYNQPRLGDWDAVLADVVRDLRCLFPTTTSSERNDPPEGPMRLNLGCGQNKQVDYINVDKYDACAPDVVWDLETFPWPFETNSVDEIIMRHALEHMGATVEIFLSIMKELYRICIPDAKILIAVPHPRSDGFTGDPTHVRVINPAMMSLFSKKKNQEWKTLGWPNTPLANYIDVDFDVVDTSYLLTPHWLNLAKTKKINIDEVNFAINSYFNVVDEVSITLKVCK